jgi:2-polyprenyl-6-methoxyphenol hydroxylase-like FAD-dependent oxidoreductase
MQPARRAACHECAGSLMHVAIIGAGPAGLYLAYLLKRARPDFTVRLYEQNPAGATFGFGLAFSDRALEFLRTEDADTWSKLESSLERWSDSRLYLNGEEIRIDGMGYAGIGRLQLLGILQSQAQSLGITPFYNHPVSGLDGLGDADLIVGADGVNSLVRRSDEAGFGTRVSYFSNRFAWYGTAKRFETLGHAFVETPMGFFNAHFHRHAPDMSTFVVEMDEKTFRRGGFGTMTAEEAKMFCERVFAEILDGALLISNKSIWRQFPKLTNAHWSRGNRVLIGDAVHTAHFSIGSGTRLAMEDSIALVRALESQDWDIPASLAAFETSRAAPVAKLVAAADASAHWYENFAAHMRLASFDFAMSYITRSGRVDLERLRQTSPEFITAYESGAKR